jgi:hypothetical protein
VDDDAGTAAQGSTGRRRSSGAGGRDQRLGREQLCPSRSPFGEVIIHAQGVVVDANDAATFQVAEDAGAGDLQRIGYVGG